MKKVLLIFVVLIFCYECKKDDAVSREPEFKLKISINNYYDKDVSELDAKAISVEVYRTKNDVGTDNVVAHYTGRNFANGEIEVVVQKYYEVVIDITTLRDTDDTEVIGDLPENSTDTSRKLQFTMNNDKTFIVTLSTNKISKIEFTLIAGVGGYIDAEIRSISGNTFASNDTVGYNSTKIIKFSQSLFKTHKVLLISKVSRDYTFTKWKIRNGAEISDKNTLEINASSQKNIEAVFTYVTPDYGTEIEPDIDSSGRYEIKSKGNLIYIANKVNAGVSSWNRDNYIIVNDIDYNGTYHLPIGKGGDISSHFSGVIDGNNKKIINAKFGTSGSGTSTYTGFVGNMNGGTIKNLIIDSSCEINSSAFYVGSIVGNMYGGIGSISNSVNKASIKTYGSSSVGGIAGYANGIILNVYNLGHVYVDSSASTVYVGGLIGYYKNNNNDSLYLTNAYNIGNITYSGSTANPHIGGVLGSVDHDISIANVYNTGTVTSSGITTRTGGVFGYAINTGSFNAANIYFTGNASLPITGFGTGSDKINDSTVIKRSNLSALANTFNSVSGMSGVWEDNSSKGRPIIKVLPAE